MHLMDNILQTLTEIDNIEVAHSYQCTCDELHNHINVTKNDLTIISQNIRSIYCNFNDFELLLSTFKFETDIIVLTECRLQSHKPIPQISNYLSFQTTRQLNQNDGVVVYVKKTLKPKVKEISLAQASCLQLDILNNIILGIYRSPSNTNTDCFLDSLSTHLNTLKCSQQNIVIAGDININLKSKDNEPIHEYKNRVNYLNMLSLYGILSGHSLPTRELSCLDHFMIKINKKKVSAFIAILHTTITDHFTTFMSLSKLKSKQVANKTISTVDFEQALENLKENKLAELLFCDDPDQLADLLIHKLTESLKDNTVIKTIPNSKRTIKPWITAGILRCIKNRNKLQKKTRSDPFNDVLKITYRRYRNYCNKLIKKLKRKFERELLAKSVSNNKLLWKNIKTVTYTNNKKSQDSELLSLKSSPTESVNYINDYFANIGKDLAQNIQPSIPKPCTLKADKPPPPSQANSFVLLNTDAHEVGKILMNLKSDSAPGWDKVSTRFLKHVGREIVPILTHLINLCFAKGVFPTPLKQSIIIPVHKGGDRDEVNNYRPISILPAISKIMEKIFNDRLIRYFKQFNILSSTQFGFRQGISTEDAVTALSTLIADNLDNGTKCLTVFLDLKKAFDTVSIPILINKLEAAGIRGTPLKFAKDYLSNRKQRVKVGTFVSRDADITFGVPQGSVLGPTLFLLYINNLCNLKINNATVFSYADDTAVVFTGRTWHDVALSAEAGMTQVARWLNDNLLTFNTAKTNYICFSISNRSQPSTELNLRVHTCDDSSTCSCPTLDKVTQTKYLGVVVDQNLSWYPHLEQVNNRIRKLSWIFKTLRHIVPKVVPTSTNKPRHLLNEIYIALVQSVLTYCIPTWGGAAKTKFIDLERGQRALIKMMYFKNMRFSTQHLYQISNLLSVRKLYIIRTIIKKHKSLPYDPNLNLKRRKDLVADVPQTKTKFASNQFKKRSAQLYNKCNRETYVYNKKLNECKKILAQWIKPLNYEETEALLL